MARLIHHPEQPLFLEMSNKPYLGQMLNDFAGFSSERVLHCRKALEM
jgi:[acyl-carrier-protein] S-malonyltransferase